MPTINQLIKKSRKNKNKKNTTPALQKCPQKKGICFKIFILTPRKPNSANRKVARVRLTNQNRISSYIPGINHNLQEYSVVLVRGGGVKDLPGIHYQMIRGKYDLQGMKNRVNARSKYGVKKS
jgi:small subunit ribosomal protein S12